VETLGNIFFPSESVGAVEIEGDVHIWLIGFQLYIVSHILIWESAINGKTDRQTRQADLARGAGVLTCLVFFRVFCLCFFVGGFIVPFFFLECFYFSGYRTLDIELWIFGCLDLWIVESYLTLLVYQLLLPLTITPEMLYLSFVPCLVDTNTVVVLRSCCITRCLTT
jgi:hypothetical protein